MTYQVILDLKSEILGGIDVFSINLAQGLSKQGIPARILFTKHYRPDPYSWLFPDNIPIDRLQVNGRDTWRNRWRAMVKYLERRAPCIYIPNNDCDYSGVAPKLSKNVIVIGVVHSDEFFHYEHVNRMGRYWNGIVAVSDVIAREITTLHYSFARRLVHIPYGVTIPDVCPVRTRDANSSLRLVYIGRLVQQQKRVLDLLPIIKQLVQVRIPVEVTIIGDGPQKGEISQVCSRLITAGIVKITGCLPNSDVLKILDQQDVILLTSDYEGLPICLLEAMGRGCIPVVTDIRSGIPELIKDGWNGFIVRHNDHETFVGKIHLLQQDLTIRNSMSMHAYETMRNRYQLQFMIDKYVNFFERSLYEAQHGIYKRPTGPILYPPRLTMSWKEHLPTAIRTAGVLVKKSIRNAKRVLIQKLYSARNSF